MEGNPSVVLNVLPILLAGFQLSLIGRFWVSPEGPNGRPSIFYIAHVLWRHRNSQLIATPPQAIQRIVFPVILFIGRVLGKYRRSSWPGSPESCPGAPLVDAANV